MAGHEMDVAGRVPAAARSEQQRYRRGPLSDEPAPRQRVLVNARFACWRAQRRSLPAQLFVLAKAARDSATFQPPSPLLLAGPALGPGRDALAILGRLDPRRTHFQREVLKLASMRMLLGWRIVRVRLTPALITPSVPAHTRRTAENGAHHALQWPLSASLAWTARLGKKATHGTVLPCLTEAHTRGSIPRGGPVVCVPRRLLHVIVQEECFVINSRYIGTQ